MLGLNLYYSVNPIAPHRTAPNPSLLTELQLVCVCVCVRSAMWFDVQKWHDDYLMWDPEQYAAIERLNMAAGTSDARIWTPDIQLLNTYVTS